MIHSVNAAINTSLPIRRRSRLVQIGEAAMRAELLAALEAHNWNLAAAGRSVGLAGASSVLRMIPKLNLAAEYNAAKRDGRVTPGKRIAHV